MKKTKHHLVPSSRCTRARNRSRRRRKNIRKKCKKCHVLWHQLFWNLMPHEAVMLIVTCWAPENYFDRVELAVKWEGKKYNYEGSIRKPEGELAELTADRRKLIRKLFGRRTWFEIVKTILESWVPLNYIRWAAIKANNKAFYRGGKPADWQPVRPRTQKINGTWALAPAAA